MKHTLSTTQWQRLQDLFGEAESLDDAAIEALLRKVHNADPLVAESLAGMLAAHQHWQSRTADAVQHLAQSTQVSAVGARLGVYQLVSEIGRGGMGVVYLGERVDGQVQQQVAIKVLHTQNLDDNTRARFQREREILAGFEHPGIARLLDAGESAAGEPYFVMEYLRGASLTAHCDAQRLGIRARLLLFLQVCDAVQYAHGQLILHRDIKPSNVLVDSAGIPKLIDFGIAKPLHDGGAIQPDETALAQRFFSPVNAAPEQIRGESVAVTCDVYQLGTLLYELLCGQALFDLRGKTATQIEEQICEIAPRAPSDNAGTGEAATASARNLPNSNALQRALRGDLDAITLRAVRKAPASRYASVEQFADDVRRYLDNLPVHGRRGSTWYRMQRFAQRHWRALTVAGVAAAGVIAFTVLLARQQQAIVLERDNAVAERDRGEAVATFLVDIFRMAEPSPTAAAQMTIREALKKGEELLDGRQGLDPRTHARLASTLVDINLTLSNLDKAEHQMLKVLELLEAIPNGDPLILADQYQKASGLFYMRDDMQQCGVMADKAIALYDQFGAPFFRSWPARLNSLRMLEMRDKKAACEGLERLLVTVRNDPESVDDGLGSVMKEVSHCRPNTPAGVSRNETDMRQVIEQQAAAHGAEDSRVLQLKQRLSLVLIAGGRLDAAAELLDEILPQQVRIYGESSWPTSYTWYGFGNISYERGRYAEAEKLLTRARSGFSATHGKVNSDLALVDFAMARVQEFGYHDTAKAMALYRSAVDIARETLGKQAEK